MLENDPQRGRKDEFLNLILTPTETEMASSYQRCMMNRVKYMNQARYEEDAELSSEYHEGPTLKKFLPPLTSKCPQTRR